MDDYRIYAAIVVIFIIFCLIIRSCFRARPARSDSPAAPDPVPIPIPIDGVPVPITPVANTDRPSIHPVQRYEIKLKTVQIFFRHGARTPLKHINGLEEVSYDRSRLLRRLPHTEAPITVYHLLGGPRPPSNLQAINNKVTFKGGMHAGILTDVGREQSYQFGRSLALKYRDFVGSSFDEREIYLRSTNMDRCIESLQCCVAGLFGVESFDDQGPAPIYVETIETEILFPNSRNCEAFKRMLTHSRSCYESSSEYISLVKKAQKLLGDTTTPIDEFDMMQLRDHIVARQVHGLPVPKFLLDIYPEVDRAAVDILLHYVCGYIRELCKPGLPFSCIINASSCTGNGPGPQTYRDCTEEARTVGLALSMGRTWHMIQQTLESAIMHDGKQRPKFLLYCCHDSSIAPLLLALGCYDDQWPPYVADVAIELYEDSDHRHWIKVTYCGQDMVLAGCNNSLIPLEQFLDIIKPYVISPEQQILFCSDLNNWVNHVDGTEPSSRTNFSANNSPGAISSRDTAIQPDPPTNVSLRKRK